MGRRRRAARGLGGGAVDVGPVGILGGLPGPRGRWFPGLRGIGPEASRGGVGGPVRRAQGATITKSPQNRTAGQCPVAAAPRTPGPPHRSPAPVPLIPRARVPPVPRVVGPTHRGWGTPKTPEGWTGPMRRGKGVRPRGPRSVAKGVRGRATAVPDDGPVRSDEGGGKKGADRAEGPGFAAPAAPVVRYWRHPRSPAPCPGVPRPPVPLSRWSGIPGFLGPRSSDTRFASANLAVRNVPD